MRGQTFLGNTRGAPLWAIDGASPENMVAFPAKVNPALFTDFAAVSVTVDAAGAAANATSIPVTAVTYPEGNAATVINTPNRVLIPNGSAIYFGASKKLALLTADFKQGDTAMTVQALPTALVSGDIGVVSAFNTKLIPAGTFVGRTYAMRDANTPFRPWITGDDEAFLTMFDIVDANLNDDVEFYLPTRQVKENYLPGYAAIPGGTLTAIRAAYRCIKGVD